MYKTLEVNIQTTMSTHVEQRKMVVQKNREARSTHTSRYDREKKSSTAFDIYRIKMKISVYFSSVNISLFAFGWVLFLTLAKLIIFALFVSKLNRKLKRCDVYCLSICLWQSHSRPNRASYLHPNIEL